MSGDFGITSDEEMFKRKVLLIDKKISETRKLLSKTSENLYLLRNNKLQVKDIENNRKHMNEILKNLPNEIDELERLAPRSGEQSILIRSRINDKRKEVTIIIRDVRNLLSEINSEIIKRRNSRNKETSVINAAMEDYDSNAGYHKKQMMSNDLDQNEINIALEEQRQCEQIARDMVILENLFQEVSKSICEQGEMVDRITENVNQAYTDVDKGEQNLNKAVGHKRAAFKKKMIIIIIVLVALAVLALIIGLSVGLNK